MQPFAGGAREKSVVTYKPSGAVGQILFALVFIVIGGAVMCGGIWGLHSVHLRCDRAAASCSRVTTLGPWSSTDTIALPSIRSTRLETIRGSKGRVSYEVDLVTGGGNVELASPSTSAEANALKAQVDRFLLDKTAPTLDVACQNAQPVALVGVLFGLVFVLAGWATSWFARVEVDWASGTLSILTVRWPLAPKKRTFELAAVRDAIVHEGRGRKGGRVYSVRLVVDGQEEPVPILNVASSGRGPKDRAVAEIQALLARR